MRHGRFAGINMEAVLKLVILLGFALFFYVTISSGNAQKYVHPRIVPYMKFGIVAMVLISLFVSRTVFKPRRAKTNLWPYLLFIIPLMSAFLLPAGTIESATISGNTLKSVPSANAGARSAGSSVIADTGRTDAAAADTEDPAWSRETSGPSEAGTDGYTDPAEQGPPDTEPDPSGNAPTETAESEAPPADTYDDPLELSGDTIVVNDGNYVMWDNELYSNMEKYKGKNIEITGKVLKDEEMEADEFGVIRMMMSCCAADLQPVGLICHYDGADGLKGDSWVAVKGKIVLEEYEGELYPVISVESVQKAEKPKDEYVYP